MSERKKKPLIIIPNSIIRDPQLKPLEFCLLLWFQYNIYLQKSTTIELGLQNLKARMDVSSDLTMKSALKNLQNHEYILNDVRVINKIPMSIVINHKKLEKGNFFTQLPKNLMGKIEAIGQTGIRLLYYYESYINRSITMNQFSYVGFEKITEHTGIKRDAIQKYNKLLVKEGFLTIQKHKSGYNGEYNDDDRATWTRYNNHCYVNLDKLYDL